MKPWKRTVVGAVAAAGVLVLLLFSTYWYLETRPPRALDYGFEGDQIIPHDGLNLFPWNPEAEGDPPEQRLVLNASAVRGEAPRLADALDEALQEEEWYKADIFEEDPEWAWLLEQWEEAGLEERSPLEWNGVVFRVSVG